MALADPACHWRARSASVLEMDARHRQATYGSVVNSEHAHLKKSVAGLLVGHMRETRSACAPPKRCAQLRAERRDSHHARRVSQQGPKCVCSTTCRLVPCMCRRRASALLRRAPRARSMGVRAAGRREGVCIGSCGSTGQRRSERAHTCERRKPHREARLCPSAPTALPNTEAALGSRLGMQCACA